MVCSHGKAHKFILCNVTDHFCFALQYLVTYTAFLPTKTITLSSGCNSSVRKSTN